MDSYSGPSPRTPPASVTRAQPMGQPQQALRFTRMVSASASPESRSAPAKLEWRKLYDGKEPSSFRRLTRMAVP